ncbi:TPA: hypothetical protein ACGU4W_001089 [Vibrio vulnificus]|nr:hypothetical protein [Vibrio vulnificus]
MKYERLFNFIVCVVVTALPLFVGLFLLPFIFQTFASISIPWLFLILGTVKTHQMIYTEFPYMKVTDKGQDKHTVELTTEEYRLIRERRNKEYDDNVIKFEDARRSREVAAQQLENVESTKQIKN